MTGTILNAAGILIGGACGLLASRQLSPMTQIRIKIFLGVLVVFVGLRMSLLGFGGGLWNILKQFLILLLALILGRLLGKLMRLQKGLNFFGEMAKSRFAGADPSNPNRFSEGFLTCTILFCVGPMAILGAVQDGLDGHWQTLGIKGIMDGLATMAFVPSFGWGVMLAVVPVVAYQGTLTLLARVLGGPLLQQEAMLDAFNITGGMLVFCIALVILEVRRIELADYLPSLAVAPLLAWLWS